MKHGTIAYGLHCSRGRLVNFRYFGALVACLVGLSSAQGFAHEQAVQNKKQSSGSNLTLEADW